MEHDWIRGTRDESAGIGASAPASRYSIPNHDMAGEPRHITRITAGSKRVDTSRRVIRCTTYGVPR